MHSNSPVYRKTSWKKAQLVIEEVVAAVNHFNITASNLGVKSETTKLISKQLDNVYQANKGLLIK